VILGVAQVVVNVDRLADAEADLTHRGYQRSFGETAIANHPAKAHLQSGARARLGLTHFSAPPCGTAVELTAYEGAPAAGAVVYRLQLPPRPGAGPALVTVAATDPEGSHRFWTEGLGFRTGSDDHHLSFPAVMPSWRLDVVLDAAGLGERPVTTVDADGCVLVTLLSTDTETDAARLARPEHGLRSSGMWPERVASRDLRVAIIEGPSGELVELVQLPARGTTDVPGGP
jgi:catechol 2,3-dioxygenase-like lactoylglutathione lyase family enzyme